MFESLTERVSRSFRKIIGRDRIKEGHIKDSLKEIRKAFLEADVALEAIDAFVEGIQQKSLGQDIASHLSPVEAFMKIVQDELTQLMGQSNVGINLQTTPPAVILMVGLQGSGKTTMTMKLAKWLKEKEHKKILVVSADVYRPAAIAQLRTLAKENTIDFFESALGEKPEAIVGRAHQQAKIGFYDVLIVDTAGRLHIDEEMMNEAKNLHQLLTPIETLFVVDSMMGQDAIRTAKIFGDTLSLTGIILTKADGDSRGGAALSVRHVTGKPIKFLGIGEKVDAIEPFYPDRMASRILGMGDVLTLIEELDKKVDKEKAEKLAKKLEKGHGFDLNDFREQMKQMQNMGGMTQIMNKLPGMNALPQHVKEKVNDKSLVMSMAVLDSMTKKERRFPDTINGSRKKRIASGSGTDLKEVNRVLKQYEDMQKMMKKIKQKGGLMQLMKGLSGGMPPNFPR